MPLSPDALAVDTEAVERLCWSFDFRLEADLHQTGWFTVDGAKACEPIGRDGAGGVFALLPPSQHILYVSSEGQAGIVAADFDEFIQLIVACPYWQDLLKYSGGGSLAEMRRAAAALNGAFDDDDDINEARDYLISKINLTRPPDPVGALHRAVSASAITVRAPDGDPCASLFNDFTIDDNPMLRDMVG
jgi:hypothetical protein